MAVGAAVRELAGGSDCVITLRTTNVPLAEIAHDHQQRVVAELARVARRVFEATSIAAVVAGGGDTAYALFVELGIGELVIDGEIEAGFPRGHGVTADGRSIQVATKAGGFGADRALIMARRALAG